MAISSFNEENSADLVCDRVGRDAAGAAFLIGLVRHLHGYVKDTRPTRVEWRQAIRLLTEIGHATDDHRQEWVLLSDLLGVTALVGAINDRRPKGATPNTARGPFYRNDAPARAAGETLSLDGKGESLSVSVRVVDLDGAPIPGATVETWQANAEGHYENQQPDRQPEFNLRGVLTSDADGWVRYRTVRPGGYAPPVDGPVGRMLASLGYPMRRPAHLHFFIRADGFQAICTQIFDGADPHIDQDVLFAVRPELIGEFRRKGGEWVLEFVFVMARAKPEGRAA